MNFKNILITGAAGFIGFHLARKLLEEGVNVIGVDNLNEYYDPSLKVARNNILLKYKNYSFIKKDIRDDDFTKELKKYKIDKICHLAAQVGVRYSLINPKLYEEVNVNGFLNILEFAREQNIKDIVFASSSSVYGGNKKPKNGLSEEDRTDNPISVYGATKKADEMLAYSYHHLFGLNLTGLRFFTVYGPWGRPDMAYFSFTKAISEGKAIDVYNFGKMKRDFTYIDDVVNGIVPALEKPFGYEIINIGNSRTESLKRFINVIEAALDKKAKIRNLPLQKGDVLETYANIDKAIKLLDFNSKTKIDEGIPKFVDWYRRHCNV